MITLLSHNTPIRIATYGASVIPALLASFDVEGMQWSSPPPPSPSLNDLDPVAIQLAGGSTTPALGSFDVEGMQWVIPPTTPAFNDLDPNALQLEGNP
jgi:hypothetical protein